MTSPTEISVQQLSKLIGTHTCPKIIDVRIDEDFNADPFLIPGAIRHPFDDVSSLAPSLVGQSVILYCQKGLKISQGAVAILRTMGINAENLKGGKFAWADAKQPQIANNILPPRNQFGQTVWVTRHRPKIDRIACPWLIRRFVDPKAQVLFVAPSQVLLVADKFNATPFDVEDVFWSHRGDECTFDTMVKEFGLQTDAMLRLADVVRGADTNSHELAPECAGLLAISVGLSRLYKDDLEQLDAGLMLYDALYRWARDGFEEGHDWPNTRAKS